MLVLVHIDITPPHVHRSKHHVGGSTIYLRSNPILRKCTPGGWLEPHISSIPITNLSRRLSAQRIFIVSLQQNSFRGCLLLDSKPKHSARSQRH
ncbi:hypothetical protein TNCV_2156661 [Trichonephila clavipes]|nr:hypothetical protein TNCV_2156661 [Trichonephila clavipes]